MTAVNFKVFRGHVPRISRRLLSPNYAQRAVNCKLNSGALDPLGGLLPVATIGHEIQTIARYRKFDDAEANDIWLAFTGFADVVRSPLANDEEGRIYWSCDDHEPRSATYAQATSASPFPAAWYALGLPLPTMQPVIASVTGGAEPVESRSYAITFAATTGEESGPSPASAIFSGNVDGTWNLTDLQTAPPNNGSISAALVLSNGRVRLTLNTVFGLAAYDTITVAGVVGMTDLNKSLRIVKVLPTTNQIEVVLPTAQTYTSAGAWARNAALNTSGMVKRIYRTAGTGGQYLYVDEVPVATTTYDDSKPSTDLGELMPTAGGLPPPKNLTSLGSLPNGCLFGITENELCLSEPYMPYNWPLSNRYAFSGKAVRAMPAGDSVVVLTQSFPVMYAGADPSAMSPMLMETYAPCASARGAVNVGGGVLYPSYDGLWLAAPGAVSKFTERLYREDEWKKLRPETFRGVFHDGLYYASYEHDDGRRVFALDIGESDSAVEILESPTAMLSNELDGELYIAKGGRILRWDADPGSAYMADWVSMDVQLGQPTNFSVAQVHADFFEIVPPDTEFIAQDQALMLAGADAVNGHMLGLEFNLIEVNGSLLIPPRRQTSKKVTFTLWYDRELIYSTEVTSEMPFVLPAGIKGEVVNIGISGSVRVHSMTIAQSTAELREASQ
ncbi:MAG: hypothetical protein Q7U48_13970 [Hydrogenophaga sp.]|nr:hypothetical protein [Hydrogenophaga sp.]